MSARRHGFLRDSRGANAVEFALVAVPFVLLLLAIVEFGRVMWTREALQETAAAGARCMGVLNTNCASAGVFSASSSTAYIQDVAKGWGILLPSSGVKLDRNATCAGVSGFSSVTLSYAFHTGAPALLAPLNSVPLEVNACFPNNS